MAEVNLPRIPARPSRQIRATDAAGPTRGEVAGRVGAIGEPVAIIVQPVVTDGFDPHTGLASVSIAVRISAIHIAVAIVVRAVVTARLRGGATAAGATDATGAAVWVGTIDQRVAVAVVV